MKFDHILFNINDLVIHGCYLQTSTFFIFSWNNILTFFVNKLKLRISESINSPKKQKYF